MNDAGYLFCKNMPFKNDNSLWNLSPVSANRKASKN